MNPDEYWDPLIPDQLKLIEMAMAIGLDLQFFNFGHRSNRKVEHQRLLAAAEWHHLEPRSSYVCLPRLRRGENDHLVFRVARNE